MITEVIPTIPIYADGPPDRTTSISDEQFAIDVKNWLEYIDIGFTPNSNDMADSLNIFSGEANQLKADVNADAQTATTQAGISTAQAGIAVNAVSSIPAGSINDTITTTTDANSSQFISDQLALKANKNNPIFTGSITEETAIAPNLLSASHGTMQYKELSQNETYTDGMADKTWFTITFEPNGFIVTLPVANGTTVKWLTDVPTSGSVNEYLFKKLNGVLYISDAGKVA